MPEIEFTGFAPCSLVTGYQYFIGRWCLLWVCWSSD